MRVRSGDCDSACIRRMKDLQVVRRMKDLKVVPMLQCIQLTLYLCGHTVNI